MNVNFLAILVAALVPLIMGFIWYNPKVFGKAWQQAAGVTDEKMKGANMAVIFGVSFILSFLLAFSIQFMVIHQFHFGSMLYKTSFKDPNTELGGMYKTIMDRFGSSYRTFKHGALHGTISGFFMATPILATNALFERKGFKYIAINCGYWIICMAIMGGIVSAWM